MLIADNQKPFEKPDSGSFIGVIADVIDLGLVDTKFGKKAKIRIVWVLDKMDSEGNPFRVISSVNASMNEKADLYKLVKAILGTAPPIPFESETLIGRSNQLFVVREKSADGTKEFANVKAILPLPTGVASLKVPANFVRNKDKNNGTPSAPAQPSVSAPVAQAQTVQPQQEVSF